MTAIEYLEKKPESDEYSELFETTGWNKVYKASARELTRAVENCWYSVAAFEEGRLVGFGRVVSDGVLYGMIYDLIVLPSHQNRGIGGELLKRLVAKCHEAGLREIQLFSAKGKVPFYRKRGFVERPEDAPGMRFAAR